MRIIFLGTPDFAVQTLEALINSKHDIVAVVTQPDKKRNNKDTTGFSPVKEVALKHNIKILQPTKIRVDGVQDLKELNPDIMITCAYGQILTQEILDIAKFGVVNVHASLLPKYRGSAPIQYSILNGDKQTGVSIMQTDVGIDTGDVLSVVKTPIGENETAGELFDRLSQIGANAMIECLQKIEQGRVKRKKQLHEKATHVKMLKRSDGEINFNQSNSKIFNFVRGMNPWPSAFTFLNGKILKLWKVEKVDNEVSNKKNQVGTVLSADLNNGIVVACKKGNLKIIELQIEGGKRLKFDDFLRGNKIEVGTKLQRQCWT